MYDTILAPVDGSEASQRAVDRASKIASEHDAEVHVLNVVEVVNMVAAAGARTAELVETFHEQATELTDENADRIADDVPVRTAVEEGAPAETIRDYAAEHDIDLIVMGTHGRTGLERVFLGSTTERVVRLSDRPVLTVSPEAAD